MKIHKKVLKNIRKAKIKKRIRKVDKNVIFVVKAAIIFFTYLFIENTYNEVQDFIIYRRLKKEIERKKA